MSGPQGQPAARTSIRVGTSGWSYPNWRGLFYPPGVKSADWLACYARQLTTVELNASFYRLPTPAVIDRWSRATPPGFLFAIKAWRVITQPAGADLTKRATSDASGHVFVVWPRFPAMLRSRLIGYIWDPVIPIDTIVPSPKTSLVSFVVARSGPRGLGQWSIERHDVAADYRRIYGEPAPKPGAVALSIDTNDTRASAAARFGRIAFLPR